MRRRTGGITIKSERELALMRQAGKIVAEAKFHVMEAVKPGVTTGELDSIAEDVIRKMGAVPSFKGYAAGGPIPFTGTICASINEEIVHGIPGSRKLNDGDIFSVDVGAIVKGFHGDSAFTVGVGDISDEAQRLIDATRKSLNFGIEQANSGARIGDIGNAVQQYAESQGYSVVRKYVGHGIGRALHEDPQVPNYGRPGRGVLIKKGMTLAIEPMLNIGTHETVQLDDGWTVVTADSELSAHFEDTIAITADGAEILTTPDGYYF
ncbi:MAG: type I methionyl aminopeptidase [Chloroflexi bacterium]|nr:type I methionyl aminopeptidase [Chloroflexota bacterium]